jgi:ATP-binding cassette subfamily G (WHITE) protein 2 (SNQ2)
MATTPSPPATLVRVETHHEPLNFFDAGGNLRQSLSRTATQDPTADGFDFKKHLAHVLKKQDREGVLRRELGVTFEGVKVTGDGSGVAYGPSMGEILTGPSRIGSAIKAARHPTRKNILFDITFSIAPTEMLLVLGRPGSGCSTLLRTLANRLSVSPILLSSY